MQPTAPMFPRSTRRSSILSQLAGRRSELLVKNATVVLGDACCLVRESEGRNVEVTAGQQCRNPCTRHWRAGTPRDGGGGTVNQQLAQICVPVLPDPAEPLLAAARMLLWNQADPGGKVPPRG